MTQCLTMTTNLITAPVINRVVASDRPSISTVIFIVLCICGVVFMVQPPGLFPNTQLSTLNIASLLSEACNIPVQDKNLFEQKVKIWASENVTHGGMSLNDIVTSLLDSANSSTHLRHLALSLNVSSCDQTKLDQFDYYAQNAWLGMCLNNIIPNS